MAQALIKAGHSVTMVCGNVINRNTGLNNKPFSKGFRRGIVDGIDVIEYELNYSNNLNFLKRIIIFIKFASFSIFVVFREPADIVFATSTPLTIGIPGLIARWFKKKKFIFEVRDLWPEIPRAMGIIKNSFVFWILSFFEGIIYKSANRIIALSPGIAEGIAKKGIIVDRIDIIPNGSDLDFFNLNKPIIKPKSIGQDLTAIFAGTHGLANGLDSVLDAAAILKKRGKKNIKIILVGDGKLKKRLILRANQESLENIKFLNYTPKIKLKYLFKNADIGLQVLENIPAFYYGTSPNKFFDYLAAGLPILNNYPGWIAELITKYKCGFSIEPCNAEIFADKLVYASKNFEELKQMGVNSKYLANKKFNMRTLEEKFVKCFENLINFNI